MKLIFYCICNCKIHFAFGYTANTPYNTHFQYFKSFFFGHFLPPLHRDGHCKQGKPWLLSKSCCTHTKFPHCTIAHREHLSATMPPLCWHEPIKQKTFHLNLWFYGPPIERPENIGSVQTFPCIRVFPLPFSITICYLKVWPQTLSLTANPTVLYLYFRSEKPNSPRIGLYLRTNDVSYSVGASPNMPEYVAAMSIQNRLFLFVAAR